MSDEPGRGTEYTPTTGRPAGWAGFPIFAALLLMLAGGANIISGLVALVKDEIPVPDPVLLDVTAWGWVAIVLGALGIIVGLGVLAGQTWAVVAGVAFAVVNGFAHMALLPSYPARSLVVIGLDVLIVYALTVHGRDLRT